MSQTTSSPSFFPYKEWFALDLRSLALLRVALAFLLLLDWADRVPDLYAHYTDDGMLPRQSVTGVVPISIHLYSGAAWFQGALMAVAIVLAFLLLIGYRTTLVTLLNWFLLISVHARFPVVMQGGDQVMRMVLFWGMFLPLGACWSVDAALSDERPTQHRHNSLASIAYIVQICLVYLFAAAWKWAPEWREEGTAVYLTLQIDYFVTRFSAWLRELPFAVSLVLTRGTIWLETLGPIALFLPFSVAWQRLLVIVSFILFHIGLAISMELSLFPWMCVVAWLALLPGTFWDKVQAHYRTPAITGLVLHLDPERSRSRLSLLRTFLFLEGAPIRPVEDAGLLSRIRKGGGWGITDAAGTEYVGTAALRLLFSLSPVFFPLARLCDTALARWLVGRLAGPIRKPAAVPQPAAPRWAAPAGELINATIAFFLLYVIVWNIRTFDFDGNRAYLPDHAAPLGQALGLEQGWGLFAPWPGRLVGWHVVAGIDLDGNEVDVLTGQPLSWDKPALLAATYGNGRWRKLMMNLPDRNTYPYFLPSFARYFLQRWNREHTGRRQLREISVYWMREVTVPPGEPARPVDRVLLIRYQPEEAEAISWFVVAGTLPDGKKVDLLRAGAPPVDWRRPDSFSGQERPSPWHSMLNGLRQSGALNDMLPGFAKNQFEEWNRRHRDREGEKLQMVEVFQVRPDAVAPDGLRRDRLVRHPTEN